jgi:hypothetical protein
MSYPTSTLIGDWPFISNILSEFRYAVNENKFAVGFVLDKKNFIEITERYMSSSQEFFKISQMKIEFIKRINKSLNFSSPLLHVNHDDNLAKEENIRNTINKFSDIDNCQTQNPEINLNFQNENKSTINAQNPSNKFEIKKKVSDYKVRNYFSYFLCTGKNFRF